MRLLLTRAEEDGRRSAQALAANGHEAVLAPVTRIVPLASPLPAGPFDAVLATSRHALSAAAQTAVPALTRLPLLAVGRSTAAAARAAGWVDVRVAAGDARALVDLVRLTLPPASALLYLAGRDRKPHIEEALAGNGMRLTVHVAYAAEPCSAWPEPVCRDLAAGRFDACLHFSRRSAGLAVALAAGSGLGTAFLALPHLCLSPDVAEPLTAAGARAVAIAEDPTEAGLLAAADRFAARA